VEQAAAEREAFVARAAASDDALAQQVVGLLRAAMAHGPPPLLRQARRPFAALTFGVWVPETLAL